MKCPIKCCLKTSSSEHLLTREDTHTLWISPTPSLHPSCVYNRCFLLLQALHNHVFLKNSPRYLKGVTEGKMVRQHHWQMEANWSKLWETAKDRRAWCAALHGITKSRIRLSGWTATTWMEVSTWIENLIIKTQVQSMRSIRMSLPKYFSYGFIPVACTMLGK